MMQSSGWKNPFEEKPLVERVQDPLGREMYSIRGVKYYATYDELPVLGGYVVGTTGAVLQVVEIDSSISHITGKWERVVTAKYLDDPNNTLVSLTDYKVLAKVVQNPCPWCGDELTEAHLWRDASEITAYDVNVDLDNMQTVFTNMTVNLPRLGRVLWQFYKYCESCGCIGISPEGEKDNITWWNGDEQMFDKDTKDIIYNPNFIDED